MSKVLAKNYQLRAKSCFHFSKPAIICLTHRDYVSSNSPDLLRSRARSRSRSTPMQVAFLGLGIMGQAMATNLVRAGHEVTVWNRTPGKVVEGARVAASPAEAAHGVEVVWMAVADTAAVER